MLKILQIAKIRTFAPTIVEPTGVPTRIAKTIPKTAQNTEKRTDNMQTLLNELVIFIAEIVGKTMSAETRSEPTSVIARDITIAMIIDNNRFVSSIFTPVAFAYSPSNVTAKMFL